MAQIIDTQNGTTITQGMATEQAGGKVQPEAGKMDGNRMRTDALGNTTGIGRGDRTDQARQRAAQAASPR